MFRGGREAKREAYSQLLVILDDLVLQLLHSNEGDVLVAEP